MRRDKRSLALLRGLVMAILAIPCLASSQPNFPTYEELTQSNVCLNMIGCRFTAGIEGEEVTGDGLKVVPAKWAGSGFVVKADGTLVTNYHVLRHALKAQALFEDESSYEISSIKAVDFRDDIAVMQMKAQKECPTVTLGNSDSVKPMDDVLAVGNSAGQRLAFTKGIVGRLERREGTKELWLIRHSAYLNPGNSGGALYRGKEVIGVNVAANPRWNFHYAIPINKVKPLLGPEYGKAQPLSEIFIPTVDNLKGRLKQVFAANGQVEGRSGEEPGIYPVIGITFEPMEDYLVLLRSQRGRDLDVVILTAEKRVIGCGLREDTEMEGIFLSNDYAQWEKWKNGVTS